MKLHKGTFSCLFIYHTAIVGSILSLLVCSNRLPAPTRKGRCSLPRCWSVSARAILHQSIQFFFPIMKDMAKIIRHSEASHSIRNTLSNRITLYQSEMQKNSGATRRRANSARVSRPLALRPKKDKLLEYAADACTVLQLRP